MFAELLGFPSGELGPAVISRIGSKPEITMKTLILAAICCSLYVNLRLGIKRIIAMLFVAVFCHLFSCDSEATATYDTSVSATIQFSQPWVSVAHVTTPDPNPFVGPAVTMQHSEGKGSFTAFTRASESGTFLQ
jgi:hypothetical protein